jgi:hypothetical protein
MQINWPLPGSQSSSSTHFPAAARVSHQILDPTHDDRSISRHHWISIQTQGEPVRDFTGRKAYPAFQQLLFDRKGFGHNRLDLK